MSDEAIALLRKLEYCAIDGRDESCCPACFANDGYMHWRGCRLAAIIGNECAPMSRDENKARMARDDVDRRLAQAKAEVARLEAEASAERGTR